MARNCSAKINTKDGATAEDWKKGKPVRVVRNCKGRKHSTYAPEEGNRYDGIYKVILIIDCTSAGLLGYRKLDDNVRQSQRRQILK